MVHVMLLCYVWSKAKTESECFTVMLLYLLTGSNVLHEQVHFVLPATALYLAIYISCGSMEWFVDVDCSCCDDLKAS